MLQNKKIANSLKICTLVGFVAMILACTTTSRVVGTNPSDAADDHAAVMPTDSADYSTSMHDIAFESVR